MAQFQATTKSAEAPDLGITPGESTMFDGLFTGVSSKRVKGGQYTKDTVNGDPKLEWGFKLLDDDGTVIRNENEDSESFGKPVIVTKLTGTGFNIASKTTPGEVKMLKALLTGAEYAAFEAGEGTPDSEAEAPEGLLGRKVQLEVFINDSGWPAVGNVIAARKPKRAKAAQTEDE